LQTGTSLSDLTKNAGLDATTLASVIQDGLLFDTRA
jgi:lambda repressor-like predicted transcriptional regulator